MPLRERLAFAIFLWGWLPFDLLFNLMGTVVGLLASHFLIKRTKKISERATKA